MRSWLTALALLMLPSTALAGYKLLINDDFESGDHAAMQGGFVQGECWGVVYVPSPGDYPFDMIHVDALIGGTTAHAMFGIEFYELSGTNMNNGNRLDSSAIALSGSNNSMQRVYLDDADLEMSLPTIESGNIAVAMCLEAHDGYPAIARDVGGMQNADRNYIYLPGHNSWWQSNLFGLSGDWIQRLCIETDSVSGDECDVDADSDADSDTDTDSDADADSDTDTAWDTNVDPGDLSLISITPVEMNLAEPIEVFLQGTGFGGGMDARIGGISITGLEVINGETLKGRTPSSLPAGTHDVEVVLDADNAYLPAAFTVIGDEEGGCSGCASQGATSGLAWAGLGLLGMMMVGLRRRED